MILQEVIESKILLIRGKKVMLDRGLAMLYGVETKVLNQAVKRNVRRFPEDFMFQLLPTEKVELVTNCDRFRTLRHSTIMPYVFTENGVAMLSSVLNSERAISVNIQIMRAFTRIREMLSGHKELAHKLTQLEGRIDKHDGEIKAIFGAIRQLMTPPETKKRKIGFGRDQES
ncbi:MAG: ORF6N domain-containing protein [Nitrospiraceae bacterium]|nr:ORF6N domain-containing protein [Nitrospiraceae bacterium]